MTEKGGKAVYAAIAATAVATIVAMAVLHRPADRMPQKLPGLAAWVGRHPADWFALSAIATQALDARVRDPDALWLASFVAARATAPARRNAELAFVRSGLFHWRTLSSLQRQQVLDAMAPLLSEPETFEAIAPHVFGMTRDLEYLRRNGPKQVQTTEQLMSFAAAAGLYDDYRHLRADAARERMAAFEKEGKSLSPSQLINLLPVTIRTEHEPLLRGVLGELHERPVDRSTAQKEAAERIIGYALRHGLGPLDGFEPMITTPDAVPDIIRARLFLHLGNDRAAATIHLSSTVTDQSRWTEYYLERAAFERARGKKALADEDAARAIASRPEPVGWRGLCGEGLVCTSALREILVLGVPRTGSIRLAPGSADAAPYFELYADDTRVAEGELTAENIYEYAISRPGIHAVQLNVVSPFTRDGRQRSLRVVSLDP